jgi:hypothetical protein
MRGIVGSLLLLTGLAGAASAVELRVAAVPPLSGERWRDALRSYVDGVVIHLDPTACQEPALFPTVGQVFLCLGKDAGPDATTLLLVDAEETIVARFPALTRTEDLYRAAALKVHAVLSRRGSPAPANPPTVAQAGVGPVEGNAPPVILDLGVGLFLPRLRPAQGAFKVGLSLPLGNVALGAGLYLLSAQSTLFQGVDIQQRDLPMYLRLAYAPLHGRLRPELGVVFHGVIRRVHATGVDGAAFSHTAFSPRLGGGAGALYAVSPWYTAMVRVSGLLALTDERYQVDGQTAVSEGGATVLLELGLVSPGW